MCFHHNMLSCYLRVRVIFTRPQPCYILFVAYFCTSFWWFVGDICCSYGVCSSPHRYFSYLAYLIAIGHLVSHTVQVPAHASKYVKVPATCETSPQNKNKTCLHFHFSVTLVDCVTWLCCDTTTNTAAYNICTVYLSLSGLVCLHSICASSETFKLQSVFVLVLCSEYSWIWMESVLSFHFSLIITFISHHVC